MKTPFGDLVQVKVISRRGNSVLVEYISEGLLIRKYVPAGKVEEAGVSEKVLLQGIPYGYPWDEIEISFDAKKFLKEMHNVGLWTAEDVLKSPKLLWSALRATLADNVSNILQAAKVENKRS